MTEGIREGARKDADDATEATTEHVAEGIAILLDQDGRTCDICFTTGAHLIG